LFDSLWNEPGDPIERIKSLGLEQIDDSTALEAIVNTVIKQNADQVEQLKSGKTKVLGFLVGQVMKETSGKANPKKVNELIRTILQL
ncbi:MAG: Asp-tRNA(Asn)/Glu-tRNA(Gln) amidotransferase GatCAB subunit B, partial [Candidatus Azotimanducaceae bacterium]